MGRGDLHATGGQIHRHGFNPAVLATAHPPKTSALPIGPRASSPLRTQPGTRSSKSLLKAKTVFPISRVYPGAAGQHSGTARLAAAHRSRQCACMPKSTPKAAAPAKKPGSALSRPVQPDAALAAIVGSDPLPGTAVT